MALLVLFATTSFSVDMHYCGNHLMDFSLSGKAEGCAMQVQVAQDMDHCPMMDMKMDCCSDLELSLAGQDDLQPSLMQMNLDSQVFIASFSYTYVAIFTGEAQKHPSFNDYSPPPLIRDVQILDQTFLI